MQEAGGEDEEVRGEQLRMRAKSGIAFRNERSEAKDGFVPGEWKVIVIMIRILDYNIVKFRWPSRLVRHVI